MNEFSIFCFFENLVSTIFLGYDGRPVRKYALSWTETPAALGYSFPYVIGTF